MAGEDEDEDVAEDGGGWDAVVAIVEGVLVLGFGDFARYERS